MTLLAANTGPPHVAQADMASLAEKLKAMKLLAGEREVLRRTLAGSVLIAAYTASFDIPDGYTRLDFKPLSEAVGRPQTAVRIGEGGMPEVGTIALNGALKIGEADLISLSIQINRLELSRPEIEILRHIAAGIRTLTSSIPARPDEGFAVLHYDQMLKFLAAPRIRLVLDDAGRPLVGVFPLREGVARKNQ